MEIVFPIEFIVHGTPVSHQAKRSESREQWKDQVRDSSRVALPDPHFASDQRIAVTLFYFPPEPMQGDIDNIVKLILDACCAHIYLDDSQVERVLVQKFEPDHLFSFGNPSATFVQAFEGAKPALYVRISNDPHEELQ
ncbi:RusA family crossover junction endodeoxyribonuclease [Mesorhizobium sp. B1-1-8]|uniref:RusA family crossover junction endodeoxyribonuclease n=1 Tax=Mesorhizobium sp. B1-1-8 TaxID=2589976 RepID=UPI0011265B69|nr:RusA family crossover junction endodeoxyribonuclease [Mesorhizobium sp. B1-1-8]UCI08491.1 RusA family crossover junction endodeoxyribonuclease [Mesorhizobium sp. B1-1-8]